MALARPLQAADDVDAARTLAETAADHLDEKKFAEALDEATRAEALYHAAGIRQGGFRIALPLPARVDPERVEARSERGLLRLTLPNRVEAE